MLYSFFPCQKKKGIGNINYLDGITLKLEVYVKTTESKRKKEHRKLRETGRQTDMSMTLDNTFIITAYIELWNC